VVGEVGGNGVDGIVDGVGARGVLYC
jgi:hypothetical protein